MSSRRQEKQEQRKRGAATRQYNDVNIQIKTPKRRRDSNQWVSVSRDAGALITEELSQQFSPETHYTGVASHGGSQEEEVDEELIDQSYPEPDYGGKQNERGRRTRSAQAVAQEETPGRVERRKARELKKQKAAAKSKSTERAAKRPIMRATKKAVEKRVKPTTQNTTDKQANSSKNTIQKKGREAETRQERGTEVSYTELESDDDEELENDNTAKTISFNRLPTTSNRLSAIDVIIHLLEYHRESSLGMVTDERRGVVKAIEDFYDYSLLEFQELLDINLLNNDYIYKLRQLKHEKNDLRLELFNLKKQINYKLQELEELRYKYNQIVQKLKIKKKVNDTISFIKANQLQSSDQAVWQKLNELNKIFDPNWGLINKLKCVNEKLYELDQKL